MTATSIVTPETNGATPPVSVIKTSKDKAKASTAMPSTAGMTALQACEIAYNYGASLAGIDGDLTKAFVAFKDDTLVQADMVQSLCVGYIVKKLGYSKEAATATVNKLSYNPDPKKHDDVHRTFAEQRVMDTVRVIVHRAKAMAGIVKAKTPAQVTAEAKRAQADADRKELGVDKLAEIVAPSSADVDVNEAMTRLVSTMKAFHKKHAGKFTGDVGMAWRDWLAAAPK